MTDESDVEKAQKTKWLEEPLLRWGFPVAVLCSLMLHLVMPLLHYRPEVEIIESRGSLVVEAPLPDVPLSPDAEHDVDAEEESDFADEPEESDVLDDVEHVDYDAPELDIPDGPEPPVAEPIPALPETPEPEQEAMPPEMDNGVPDAVQQSDGAQVKKNPIRTLDRFKRRGKSMTLAERLALDRERRASQKRRREEIRNRRSKQNNNQTYDARRYPQLAKGKSNDIWACNANDVGILASVTADRSMTDWVSMLPTVFSHFDTDPNMQSYAKSMRHITGRKRKPVKRVGRVEFGLPARQLIMKLDAPRSSMLRLGRADVRCLIGMRYKAEVFLPVTLYRVPAELVKSGRVTRALVDITLDEDFGFTLKSVDETALPFSKGKLKNANKIARNIENHFKVANTLKDVAGFFGFDYEEKQRQKRKDRREQRNASKKAGNALKQINTAAKKNTSSSSKSSQSTARKSSSSKKTKSLKSTGSKQKDGKRSL